MTEVLASVSGVAIRVLAQAPPPPSSGITISRSWTMEIVVTVVMIGLALYAVTRQSRRG